VQRQATSSALRTVGRMWVEKATSIDLRGGSPKRQRLQAAAHTSAFCARGSASIEGRRQIVAPSPHSDAEQPWRSRHAVALESFGVDGCNERLRQAVGCGQGAKLFIFATSDSAAA